MLKRCLFAHYQFKKIKKKKGRKGENKGKGEQYFSYRLHETEFTVDTIQEEQRRVKTREDKGPEKKIDGFLFLACVGRQRISRVPSVRVLACSVQA